MANLEPSAEIKASVLAFYEALGKGDNAAIGRLVSRADQALVVGTDPAEWLVGHATITSIIKSQMEEMGGGFRFEAGDVQAYREGSVGWAADQPTLAMPDGSSVPMRLTGVFHNEDGGWKAVQVHLSLGVGNEDALGKELTT